MKIRNYLFEEIKNKEAEEILDKVLIHMSTEVPGILHNKPIWDNIKTSKDIVNFIKIVVSEAHALPGDIGTVKKIIKRLNRENLLPKKFEGEHYEN